MPLIYFFAFILIEIALFAAVGGAVGVLPTLLLVIGGFFAGSAMIRRSGQNLRTWAQTTQAGISDTNGVTGQLAWLFAGMLLILPGFFTDLVGLAILFPPTRALMMAGMKRLGKFVPMAKTARAANDDIIEGVVVKDDGTTHDHRTLH